MAPPLRGVFLTSDNPEATARFYRDVAGLALEQVGGPSTFVYWRVDHDGLQFAIHSAQRFAQYTDPALRQSNLTHLYFKIENQSQFLARLRAFGLEPYAIDDVVVTVEDPDGRKAMFGTA